MNRTLIEKKNPMRHSARMNTQAGGEEHMEAARLYKLTASTILAMKTPNWEMYGTLPVHLRYVYLDAQPTVSA